MADAESGPITVGHPVAGSDRYLLVGFLQGSSDYGLDFSSGPTYNGASLSELINSVNVAANVRVRVYGLVAPATGTNNVAFTYNAASTGRTVVAIRSFTGVNQSTPLGTLVAATAAGGTRTVNVASAVDELVVDMGLNRAGGTVTVGAGQTQRVNQASAVADQVGVSSDEAGAATVTMSWTSTGGDEWVLVGIPLKPAAGGGSVALAGTGLQSPPVGRGELYLRPPPDPFLTILFRAA